MNIYNLSPGKSLIELKSDKEKGLSKKEALNRKEKYGLNKLDEKKKVSPWVLFFNQFRSFIIYILIFATIVSFVSGETTEAVIILVILLFNAFFGFFQEYRAEKSIEALSKISAHRTRIIRDSEIDVVLVSELVPGDIILLEEGDKIPADCRILEVTLFSTAEAALTGESKSVNKKVEVIKGEMSIADRKNMVFSGTIVTSGKAKCVVVSTGMKTEIGKIADLLTTAEKELTPLQKKLNKFGKVVGSATMVVCFLVFVVGVSKVAGAWSLLLNGEILGFIEASREWFLVAISLAVAAVPEGLPAIVTVALSIGVKKMASKNALMRRLMSVETLGGTTVICTDKTGTLTENQMTVESVWTINDISDVTGSGYNPEGKIEKDIEPMLFRAGVLCNDSTFLKREKVWGITGDPTEGALVVSGKKFGIDFNSARKEWKRVDELPFDSIRKLMSVVCEGKSKKLVFSKGAPESILDKCTRILDNGKVRKIKSSDKDKILAQNESYGHAALRVLGFAYKDFSNSSKGKLETDLIFIGLQAMLDPPHPEVKGSIAKCLTAGIRVIMITGDNKYTARGIADKIGIEGNSILGKDFEKLSDLKKISTLRSTNIFARVEPHHKMEIVDILQKQGEVVAMTGDGVNDAPAIKEADIGVAMGINGTDVSKEASDMILLDDKFTTIVAAVEQGRGIYENIKKFINYLFSSNLAEVLVIFFGILFGYPLLMTAVMLLWMNLITDGLPALALSVDPYSKNLMKSKPKDSSSNIMGGIMAYNVIFVAVMITVAILLIVNYGISLGWSDMKIQTMVFTTIIIMEFVRIHAIRAEYGVALLSNKYLIGAILFSFILQLLVLYTPLSVIFGTVALGWFEWMLILIATVCVYIMNLIGHKLREVFGWFED